MSTLYSGAAGAIALMMAASCVAWVSIAAPEHAPLAVQSMSVEQPVDGGNVSLLLEQTPSFAVFRQFVVVVHALPFLAPPSQRWVVVLQTPSSAITQFAVMVHD